MSEFKKTRGVRVIRVGNLYVWFEHNTYYR